MKIKKILSEDTNPIDWVTYVDTDSLFLSAAPIIEKLYPEVDVDDEEAMCDKIATVATEVQNFINQSYNIMSMRMFNTESHRFEIKQENIARRGIWVAKKRYVQKIIWENGVTINHIDVKGLDVKRSDFPQAFREFMAGILEDLLNGVDKDTIDDKIISFKESVRSISLLDISKPTGVKGMKKYHNDEIGQFKSGAPVHVKSALSYNDFLKLKGLDKKYNPIQNGEKIVWMYMKQNPLGINSLALKGDGDPPEILEFISYYGDYEKMFDNALKKKLLQFYDALKWDSYENVNKLAEKFFSF